MTAFDTGRAARASGAAAVVIDAPVIHAGHFCRLSQIGAAKRGATGTAAGAPFAGLRARRVPS